MIKKLWQLIFGPAKPRFKQVDWLTIETQLRTVDQLALTNIQADSRHVLIQADTIVDAIFKQAGVIGQTMGERLKNLKMTLPKPLYRQLWQAHLKRNELVHEPTSFISDWEKTEYLRTYKETVRVLRGMR